MTDKKRALWERFCREHSIRENAVPLFECDESGKVTSCPFGKDGRYILRRSREMEALIIREACRVTAQGDYGSEGLLYMMHWQDESGTIVPLYIGRAGKYGKGGGNISANFLGLEKDMSKFARWGSGYAYHIGDLSAACCPGHAPTKIVQKYRRWAQRLFIDAPSLTPTLRRPVYFWTTVWNPESYNIWHDFGPCSLSFEEYLLIGVAADLFPENLLNEEGVNRPSASRPPVALQIKT